MDSDITFGTMDQYPIDSVASFPQFSSYETRSRSGFPEDALRLEQSRVSAQLMPNNVNPYIQDSITKSQRHFPIRRQTVEQRETHIAHSSPEPGLVYNSSPSSIGYVRCSECARELDANRKPRCGRGCNCGDCNRCSGNANNPLSLTNLSSVDNGQILMIFIFIVFIYMCMQCFQGMSKVRDIKDTIEGGFAKLGGMFKGAC